ncbi:hypothetical protein [Pseudomonas sp. PDM25]|uniref:hypothetical protein n=1 Tax=Pseudomonas sp. PDM25 TaxID=2854772 RepID=UPI001C448BAC|nr:hypothetical protein [Pseudomonas sp. PDM25]MBV7515887.1 hypothetical protein [Pseudomonas sp. PDM25]
MQRTDERRPDFRCTSCGSKMSLLRGTLLSRVGYPEHWLGFAQGLINGESLVDLQRRAGLCGQACKRWQVRFAQMLEQQGHTELIHWITWLRSRRVKEVNDFVLPDGKGASDEDPATGVLRETPIKMAFWIVDRKEQRSLLRAPIIGSGQTNPEINQLAQALTL